MTLRLKLMLLVAVTLTIKASFAQARTDQPDEAAPATTSTPAAYVYVANLTNPNATATNKYVYEIYAFAAAANGKLTPVPGSPFKDSLGFMEVNGKYLFGETYYLGNYISSYSIESNGALKLASKIDAQKYNPGGCGVMGPLGLDHTGTVLYNTVNFGDCTQAAVQSYEIESKTGALKYLESSGQIPYGADNLAFLGNNHVAYAAACFPVEMEEGGQVLGFERHSDGVLTVANINTPEPQPRLSSDDYCPGVIATDPINHMAIALQEADLYGDPNGKPVLSTFTADDNGNLTTRTCRRSIWPLSTGFACLPRANFWQLPAATACKFSTTTVARRSQNIPGCLIKARSLSVSGTTRTTFMRLVKITREQARSCSFIRSLRRMSLRHPARPTQFQPR
jgi:hypothetical protein